MIVLRDKEGRVIIHNDDDDDCDFVFDQLENAIGDLTQLTVTDPETRNTTDGETYLRNSYAPAHVATVRQWAANQGIDQSDNSFGRLEHLWHREHSQTNRRRGGGKP